MRKLTVILLSGLMCLMGAVSAFAITYNEAPMLKTMVAAGEIPSVEERLPEEPKVIEPFKEIGTYGGTLRVFAVNPDAWNELQPGVVNYMGLFISSRDSQTTEGNVAKGRKWSEDLKTFTIYLRKGLKWSDGFPFTVDDIIFQLEDVYGNEELTPVKPSDFSPGKKLMEAEKVDDYTLNLHFAVPYPVFGHIMRTYRSWQTHMYTPKHYLKKWHIKYNPEANKLAKEEGYENWWEAFTYHAQNFPQQEDLDLPRMLPWIIEKKTSDMMVFKRNPYYWWVDSAGNQLPYIDRIVSPIVDPEVYQLKVISGETDFASYLQLSLSNYTLYADNAEKGDYRIIMMPGDITAEVVVSLNLNEHDPVLRKINQDLRFRQALSVAINRDDINESLFFGKAVPMTTTVLPGCSYYKKEWSEYYSQYDPGLANTLLDEMNLTKRDKDGFRLRPDGKTLELTIEYWQGRSPVSTPALELIKEYWEAVGVKTTLKPEERALFNMRQKSSDHGVMEWYAGYMNEMGNFSLPDRFYPPGETSFAYDWGTWLKSDGESGEEPPEDIKEQYSRILEWGTTLPGSPEYMELADKIFDFYTKQLWYIGTVGLSPLLYIVKNNLENVPDPHKDIVSLNPAIEDFVPQYFFKK